MSELGNKSTLIIPGRIIFGTGTISEIGSLAAGYGKRVCIIYGRESFIKSGNLDRVIGFLTAGGEKIEEIGGISHDPDELLVEETVERVRPYRPDVIVGIGGGSVIDVGKAVSILLTNGGKVADYWGGRVFTRPSIPYIAVPTTSGTGSEVTKNAVITGRDGNFKKSIRSDYMIPDAAVVDPSLTFGAPESVTVSTGLDALIQNIEAFTSKNAGPITDTLALRAIELSGEYLIKAVKEPDNFKAREALSLVSLYGGIALANAGLGLAHGLSHPIGIHFGLPHGQACAVVMAKVMEYNYSARKERYDKIGSLLAGKPGVDAVAAFNELAFCFGISTRLRDYGVTEEDIPLLTEGSRGGSRNYNPVAFDDTEVAKMLKELL
ncbi:MAG: iron-containing alcohol dehydrogenase [Spirochaetes bacterium]|nr:iron-containing alcohol dehydrogenase [Spirochaetota bacterium]